MSNAKENTEIKRALDRLHKVMEKQAIKDGILVYHAVIFPVSRMGVGSRLTCHLDMRPLNKENKE